MSLLVILAVVYGFSFTVGDTLIHPAVPRPWVLYKHAAIFTGWLGLFLLQSMLVRLRKVAWHKMLGWVGVGWGLLIVIFGIATALAMARFHAHVLHEQHAALVVSLFDMVCFSSTFALAVYWRKKPEFHRRLMLAATCTLTLRASLGFFGISGLICRPMALWTC